MCHFLLTKKQLEHTTLYVILNFAPDGATTAGLASAFTVISSKTQFLDQVKTNSTSQLITGIFKLFQKLLECFSGIKSFAFVNKSLLFLVFFL